MLTPSLFHLLQACSATVSTSMRCPAFYLEREIVCGHLQLCSRNGVEAARVCPIHGDDILVLEEAVEGGLAEAEAVTEGGCCTGDIRDRRGHLEYK